jgi:ethanolamine utilization protein EutM
MIVIYLVLFSLSYFIIKIIRISGSDNLFQISFINKKLTGGLHTMKKAIGLLDTRGFTGLAVSTDAMLKSASVELLKQVSIGGGYVTTVIMGDVGSVKAAVETGTEVAKNVGEFISSHIIPRPHDELDGMFK